MKWCGVIGFAKKVETTPGVWADIITERSYYGDVNRVSRRLESTSQLNDNVNIANEFSIVADPFANQNFQAIRYIEFMGAKWKISNVEVQHPRLLLTAGGEWNGEQA